MDTLKWKSPITDLYFIDNEVTRSIEVSYQVTAVYTDPDGESKRSNVASVYITTDALDIESPIVKTELIGNYPNPLNPTTTIEFSLSFGAGRDEGHVSIDIFNIKGQKVKTLVNDIYKAGTHKVVWNGDDNHGRNVSSGIYLYRMDTEKYTSTKKMILMK